MDIKERINVLTQGAEIAQKNGALTLDEAYQAKLAIDALKSNTQHKAAFDILIKIAVSGQKKGIYTLRDAYVLYLASENIESVIPVPQPVAQQTPQPAPQPKPVTTPPTTVEKKSRAPKQKELF